MNPGQIVAGNTPVASTPRPIPHFSRLLSQSIVTNEIIDQIYLGSGTEDDPYAVEWIPNDPVNPLNLPVWKKWTTTMIMAFATLSITFASSAFSGSTRQMVDEFHISEDLALGGVSLFVLSYAIGPSIWAPLSELYGRQIWFFITYGFVTLFSSVAIASKNIQTLLVLRFFTGSFGASAITNGGGVISDIFSAHDRGLGVIFYVAAPFLGPTLGPIAGGFLGQSAGWRWDESVIAMFCGVVWIIGSLFVPETYAPVLLQKRAQKLSEITGKVYKSKLEIGQGRKSPRQLFKMAMTRPWMLFFREPIVIMLALYMAIIYGALYLTFPAFPLIFSERGWSQEISGLSFIGIMVGQILGMVFAIFDDKRSKRKADSNINSRLGPEARLTPAMVGAIFLPTGLFWFAWTNSPYIHWIVCLIGIVPFGFGQVLVFLSVVSYLIEAYTIYSASVLAANAIVRALFGAAFPLFAKSMYRNLGIHWASSIPGFLTLMCLPFPFLFYKYGPQIRAHCKYAAEAERALQTMLSERNTSESHEVLSERAGRHPDPTERAAEPKEDVV